MGKQRGSIAHGDRFLWRRRSEKEQARIQEAVTRTLQVIDQVRRESRNVFTPIQVPYAAPLIAVERVAKVDKPAPTVQTVQRNDPPQRRVVATLTIFAQVGLGVQVMVCTNDAYINLPRYIVPSRINSHEAAERFLKERIFEDMGITVRHIVFQNGRESKFETRHSYVVFAEGAVSDTPRTYKNEQGREITAYFAKLTHAVGVLQSVWLKPYKYGLITMVNMSASFEASFTPVINLTSARIDMEQLALASTR